jgi:hypothetical protein
LLPVAKWLQRHLLWQCGYDRAELESILEKIATESLDSPQLPQQRLFEANEESFEDVHGDIGDLLQPF